VTRRRPPRAPRRVDELAVHRVRAAAARRIGGLLACALAAAGCANATGAPRAPAVRSAGVITSASSTAGGSRAPSSAGAPAPGALAGDGPYAVGERVITLVDSSRTVRLPGEGRRPRTLVTVVRYPTTGPPSQVDVRNAPPDRAAGRFPLVVFGHGFAVTPATYTALLRAWATAGFVVAAPVFPLENANAPGGPDESDLFNQPADMTFVITRLLAANTDPRALLFGSIAPQEVAVSGQSDGGETALAVAYDRFYLDPRVRAAVILSGAEIPGPASALSFSVNGPPLLATQGTADVVNLPRNTYRFFAVAHRPKYLLTLLGAPHLPPYTTEQPQLGIVERVSIAFLDRYLKSEDDGIAKMRSAGNQAGVAALTALP
jgi:dienelactone hydrolase